MRFRVKNGNSSIVWKRKKRIDKAPNPQYNDITKMLVKWGAEMLEYIWNPWHGCRKYSEGCQHCYMFYLDAQRGRNGGDIYRTKTNFSLPLKKSRTGEYKIPSGSQVHVCLTSDFFLEEADAWRAEAWALMRQRQDLRFWLQTKRAERVAAALPADWGSAYDHVSLCVSAENQKRADERVPILLSLPFREKHIMCAPMLERITLAKYLETGQIRKVLADGENYDGDRVLDFEWITALYEECLAAGVLFDFIGTGNYFRKDGKLYRICKAYHQVQAQRSGMQIPSADTKKPMQPRCRDCERNGQCNGCRWCGKCGKQETFP